MLNMCYHQNMAKVKYTDGENQVGMKTMLIKQINHTTLT